MKWNEVTWYSRLLAVVLLFGIIPVASFYVGMRYKEVENTYSDLPQPVVEIIPEDISDSQQWKMYDGLKVSFEYPAEWGNVFHDPVPPLTSCEGALMKTYGPNVYHYDNTITFSRRHPDSISIGLDNFNDQNKNGCDDGGIVDLVERRDEFLHQIIGSFTSEGALVSKNNEGYVYTYYPDYWDSIGTSIGQVHTIFGPQLLVQTKISFSPYYGSIELEEANRYNCLQGQPYGTCGLSKWLREGVTSSDLRKDFDGMNHVIKTLKIKDESVPIF